MEADACKTKCHNYNVISITVSPPCTVMNTFIKAYQLQTLKLKMDEYANIIMNKCIKIKVKQCYMQILIICCESIKVTKITQKYSRYIDYLSLE